MRHFLFVLFIGFLLTASCCKEETSPFQVDENGVIISQPSLWKYALHESGSFYSNGFFKPTIIYEQKIAIPTTGTDGTQYMSMINTSNGKLEWKWSDVYPGSSSHLIFFGSYQRNSLLTWQQGSVSYCINLENGSTKWRIKREKTFETRIHSYLESNYFTTSYITRPDGYDEHIAYLGDLETGDISEFLKANYSCEYASPFTDNGWVGGIVQINQVPSDDNLLLVTYAEPLPEWQIKSFIGLYNTEIQTWVYERKQLVPPHWNNSVFYTLVHNNRYYANVGKSIVCHDIATGERVWGREFEQDFFFSGFIIEDGKLIANCEDTYTYRLNPNTGSTIWKTKGAGTCSRISYLNGVAYFVGGSTGYLHAVDTENGQVLWRIDASRFESAEASFTTNAVYCIPGEGGAKGKVIALTSMNAYCFEAAR